MSQILPPFLSNMIIVSFQLPIDYLLGIRIKLRIVKLFVVLSFLIVLMNQVALWGLLSVKVVGKL
jgi:hypothetical protein